MAQDVAAHLQQIYPQLLAACQQVLEQYGLRGVQVDEIIFGSNVGHYLQTSGCPPGTQAKQVCISLPGGGIRCFTDCVKVGP